MSYTLPLPGSHYISLAHAKEMTALYKLNIATILKPEYSGQDILVYSETFNIDDFQSFFDNPDCKGIRTYYGMSTDLKVHAIFVGVGEDGEDILPAEDGSSTLADAAKILEEGKRCPTYCPTVSL